jgi:aspartate racemase
MYFSGMEAVGQSRTFGLVSGLGVGGGIFYYKALVDAHLARGLRPRLLMVHADVHHVMAQAAARNTKELAEYLAGLLKQLALGGAEIASIPAFSPQICADQLASITPLPLISLLDAISAEVERRRFRRVALFGARVTMETQMFGRLPGTEVIMPTPGEIDTIADIYFRVVEEARISNEDFERLRALAHTLIERERLDGIVLAGTDLAFVFNPSNTDFPHVDGARVHIKAIMREIGSSKSQRSCE